MRFPGRFPVIVVFLCMASAALLYGGDKKVSSFHTDLLGNISFVQKQIMDLMDAVPQEKFTWRPAEGVRSISEVYAHIAFGNYGLLTFAGIQPPAEANWSMDPPKWEKGTTDKAAIAEMLKKSFDHLQSSIKNMSNADLEKKTNFFGMEITHRGLLFVLVGHLHEHLGQSIAYARSNGVVPPWTAAQQAQAKEDTK